MQIEAVKQRSWTKSAAICLPSNLSLHTSQSQNIQTDRRTEDWRLNYLLPIPFRSRVLVRNVIGNKVYIPAKREVGKGNRLAKVLIDH